MNELDYYKHVAHEQAENFKRMEKDLKDVYGMIDKANAQLDEFEQFAQDIWPRASMCMSRENRASYVERAKQIGLMLDEPWQDIVETNTYQKYDVRD